MKPAFITLAMALIPLPASSAGQGERSSRPNILFIAIDDQNDWVGPLQGHPRVQTPALDGLAARGTTFLNAHCQAPLCNPSRVSLMVGLRPTTTGIYGLRPNFRSVETTKDRVTLAQHFRAHGYRTLTTGKIFHTDPVTEPERAREFDVWGPAGGVGVTPPRKLIPATPMGDHPLMDWGTFKHRDEEKGDHQIATWAAEQIAAAKQNEPFFLAVGFFLPHVPLYVTPKWLELYPGPGRLLPSVKADDREDTPRFSWYLHWRLPEPRLAWVEQNGEWESLVRAYLAATSFVDAQIGRLLSALEKAGHADNTIVVVWSDHGYHLGEKGITGKNSLWERSTRVPLLFAGPGIRPSSRVSQPAELLDIYPTLAELCRLQPPVAVEGVSLVPQLRDPAVPRVRPAVTSHNQGNHTVRSARWRYIRYADGSEELYDHANDPHEWTNLAASSTHIAVLTEHRAWLPKIDLPPAPGSAVRILTYEASNDEAAWEGVVIRRSDPVPIE